MRLPYFDAQPAETPPHHPYTNTSRRKRPAHVALSLFVAGALIFGGDLPAALAQAPSDEATLAAAQAAPQIEGPVSPLNLMHNGAARPNTPTAAAPGTLPSRSSTASSSHTPKKLSSVSSRTKAIRTQSKTSLMTLKTPLMLPANL